MYDLRIDVKIEQGNDMKQKKLEEKWLCQLCGKVNDDPKYHANTHRHKMNMKKIEDMSAGEPIKYVEKSARWY